MTMNRQAAFWTIILCISISAWFYFNLDRGVMHMYLYPEFYNYTSERYGEIRQLVNYTRYINQPQDLIDTTTPEERVYGLYQAANVENVMSTDQYYSSYSDLVRSGEPVANQELCSQQLEWISNQLQLYPHFRSLKGSMGRDLTKYMDSFGMPSSAVFSGSMSWMGSYGICNSAPIEQIDTRYCIARYRLKSWPQFEIIHPKPRIRIGICLPETCDTLSYSSQNSTIDYLAKFQLNNYYKQNLIFESMFCLPDERSSLRKLPLIAKVFIYLTTLWVIFIILLSLIYETFYRKKKFYRDCDPINQYSFNNNDELESNHPISIKILQSLSIRCSIKSFLKVGSRPKSEPTGIRYVKKIDFDPIAFIRCFMTLAIVHLHSSAHLTSLSENLYDRTKLATSDGLLMLVGMNRFVDSFLIISGFLKTYNLLQKYSKHQLGNPKVWIKSNISTFYRILPPFFFIYWLFRSVVPYLGSGPFWDYGVDNMSYASVCKLEPWWKSLLVFSKFHDPSNSHCIGPSWYLTTYLHLALTTPLLVYVITNLPNHFTRLCLFVFIVLISTINNAIRIMSTTVLGSEAFVTIGGLIFHLFERYEEGYYFDTLGRLGGFVTGCYAGYLVHLYKTEKILEWPWWFKSKLSIAVALVTIAINLGIILIAHRGYFLLNFVPSLQMLALQSMPIPIFFAIANAVILINVSAIHTDSPVVRFMAHPFWTIFNKLNLVIFLINYDVILKSLQLNEHSTPHGYFSDSWRFVASCLFICVPFAMLIYIFIEAPQMNLLNIYKAKKRAIKNAKLEANSRPMSILSEINQVMNGDNRAATKITRA